MGDFWVRLQQPQKAHQASDVEDIKGIATLKVEGKQRLPSECTDELSPPEVIIK